MLSKSDNELLTRVGPGTAMGDVLRQYWLPLLLSDELPGNDSNPLRTRVLGENLIAFRDSQGRVGLLAENCPHRGASLFFGRNEECGLRCVYHGWKFDVAGHCVDMPNEPPESNFKDKVRAISYPCTERNGVIWTYMGPLETPPPLPELEWNLVPENQRHISKRYQECNWAQALEGGIDSSHSGFLHSHLFDPNDRSEYRKGMAIKEKDKHPRFEVVDTPYGVLVGARRDADEEHYYWRITQFLMPFYTMIPPYGVSPTISGHAWVPMDDENSMAWTVTWHPLRPLSEAELQRMRFGWGLHLGEDTLLPPTSAPGGRWRPQANKGNDYLLDYERQRTREFTGLPGIAIQDQAMQESMGPIYDRSKEHLGASDTGIIQVRRRWLRAAQQLRDSGVTPTGVNAASSYRVRSAAVILPRDAAWVEGAQDHPQAREGVHLDSV
jgi:phenylpropionate dioxygenase-like ring-hydroxylating dioxygenase large terminal subunit